MNIREILITILLLMAALTVSCTRDGGTLHSFKWRALGDDSDSLTTQLEWQFNNFSPFDSIEQSIELLRKCAEKDSDKRDIKMSRHLYWKARYLSRRNMYDSAVKLANDGLAMCDTAKYIYDKLRLKTIIIGFDDNTNAGLAYRHYMECMDFARKLGDKGLEAHIAILLGNLFDKIEEYDKGLMYFNLADSLNAELGFHKLTVKNKINTASLLAEIGETDSAVKTLKPLLNHPVMLEDMASRNTVFRNIFIYSGNINYLYEAYRQIQNDTNRRNLKGLYASLFTNYYFKKNCPDSVLHFDSIAMRELSGVKDYNHIANILFNHSLAAFQMDDFDEAFHSRAMYEVYVDSAIKVRNRNDVMKMNVMHEIADIEARHRLDTYRRNLAVAMILLAIVVIGSSAIIIVNRRHAWQRLRAMEAELNLERTRRKMAATVISIEQKDNMLDSLRNEISEMRSGGEINETGARRMEQSIKSHLAEHEADKAFRDMFDVMHPDFTRRLREKCPGLADSYVKIASYILMELDNKKIASLMMIKPESVRQARWRLRQRMKLPDDVSLEDALRSLNS